MQIGDAGIGQGQLNEAMQELHPNDRQNIQQDIQINGWNAWEEATDNVANMDIDMPQAEQDGPMQHPNHPQNSFDLSGSTASFYRGSGLAVCLSVEQILQNNTTSSSGTSDEVDSQPTDLQLDLIPVQIPDLTEGNLYLLVPIQSVLAPNLKRSWDRAFLSFGKGQVQSSVVEDTSKAIVPVKPIFHAIILYVWAFNVEMLA